MPEAKKPPIWAKSKQRRAAKRYLFGNFTARHLIPNEHYLNRVGLRGRKTWICLCLFTTVYLIALAHLALTCVIVGVLRFGTGGSPYFIFRNDGSLVLPEGGIFTDVRLAAPSNVSSYTHLPLSITGESHNMINLLSSGTGSTEATPTHMSINQSTIQFSLMDTLHVLSSQSGEQLLSVNSSLFQLPELPSLSANLITTKLTTNSVRNLDSIQSSRQLLMRGAAGVNIMGSFVNISSEGPTTLRGETEIELQGGSGVTINADRMPKLTNSTTEMFYHLCSCANGQLFLVQTNARGCFAAINQTEHICN